MKHYLQTVITRCSDEQFGQDAVEWAVLSHWIQLSYDLDADLRLIMGEPGKPETGKYSEIVEAYQRVCRDHEAQLVESYAPLLEEILRTVPPLRPSEAA